MPYPEKYIFSHGRTENATQNPLFRLHSHEDLQEIIIFLGGECSLAVEGNVYPLVPNDILVLQSREMHKMLITTGTTYERIVIHISNSFFVQNNCEHYKKIFTHRPLGVHNVIKPTPQLLDVIRRYREYPSGEQPLLKSVLIELLYLLNEAGDKTDDTYKEDHHIHKVTTYINTHITEDLSLDSIAAHFFLSKYYLCRSFKKSTGFTVRQYIHYKRLSMVRDLCRDGKSLTEASSLAGFGSYTNFYKVYMKEYGHAPRRDLL